MSSPESQFITPPREEETVYPYRRVWASIGIEIGMLLGIVVVMLVAHQLLVLPTPFWGYIGLFLALSPFILWIIFSWTRENFVPEGRDLLFPVFIVTALATNAVAYPLIYRFLEVDNWVTQQDTFERLIVYAFAYGTIPEVIKYSVLRYTVWRRALRYRYDIVAYSAAAAVGYATVLGVHYILETSPPPDVAAIRIFGITSLQLVNSLIVAYGLAEIRFDKPSPLLVSGMIAIASLVTGLIYTLRSNIANTSFSLTVSSPRLLLNLAITVMLLVAISLAVGFLFNTSERQAEEAKQGLPT